MIKKTLILAILCSAAGCFGAESADPKNFVLDVRGLYETGSSEERMCVAAHEGVGGIQDFFSTNICLLLGTTLGGAVSASVAPTVSDQIFSIRFVCKAFEVTKSISCIVAITNGTGDGELPEQAVTSTDVISFVAQLSQEMKSIFDGPACSVGGTQDHNNLYCHAHIGSTGGA